MLDMLYDFLAKMGFNEPLHPPITHMPIGLITGTVVFFLVAVFLKRKNLVLTARHASILAFIFAFPTILLGVMDWIHFYHAALFTPIIIKMVLAGVVLLALGAGIILGSEVKLHSIAMTVFYAAAFIAAIGLGYFGSGIIYGRGLEQKKPVTMRDSGRTVVLGETTNIIEGAGFDEKLGACAPLDATFTDEAGRPVRFGDVLHGPTILTLVYYRCPNACDSLLTGIAAVLNGYGYHAGAEPNLVTVTIDETETVSDALKAKSIAFESIRGPYPPERWRFLTGSAASIRRLADAVGFRFTKKGGDYEHPIGLIILSPKGKVVRYIPGADFLPLELRMTLLEASEGIAGPTAAKVLRFCFKYDPKGRHFAFATLRVSGTVILVLAGSLALYLGLGGKKRRNKGAQ